jgi:hypothetical protein
MRRSIRNTLIVAALAATVSLAACSGGGTTPSPSPTASSASPTEITATIDVPSDGGVKPGDRNLGSPVPAKFIEQVDKCQRSGNIKVEVTASSTEQDKRFGDTSSTVYEVTTVGQTDATDPVSAVATTAPVDVKITRRGEVFTWESKTPGLTFCEVVERPLIQEDGNSNRADAVVKVTWGTTGSYERRQTSERYFVPVVITGSYDKFPPGIHTSMSVDPKTGTVAFG